MDTIAKKDLEAAATRHTSHLPWIKPPHGFAKCNVEDVVFRQGNGVVVASVCKDENGVHLGSSSITFRAINDAPALEVLACREAWALVENLLLRHVLISSGCATVIKDLSENSGMVYEAIVKEFKTF